MLQEDLISAGIIGLIAAIDNFDPSRPQPCARTPSIEFEAPFSNSIRGLDGIPPHHRQRARQVQNAMETVEKRMGRGPEEDEIAQELGISLDDYRQTLLDVRGVYLGSLETVDGEGSLIRYIADREDLTPGHVVEREALHRLLTTAIKNMPQIERKVIGLYYMEELTLAEIGKILDLHNVSCFAAKATGDPKTAGADGKALARWNVRR